MIRFDWLCGAMALLSTYTLGKKKWYGWLISATTNALFVALNARAHLWGVVPVSALCCTLNLWNMFKWWKERSVDEVAEMKLGEPISAERSTYLTALVEQSKLAEKRTI